MGNVVTGVQKAISGDARSEGRYYSCIGDIWEVRAVSFSAADYARIKRQSYVLYVEAWDACVGPSDQLDPDLRSQRSEPYEPASSLLHQSDDSSRIAKRKDKIQMITVTGRPKLSADVAHLISHTHTCATVQIPMAEAAVGRYVDDECANDSASIRKRRKRVLVNGQMVDTTNSKKRRVDKSGVKHSAANMMTVAAQRRVIDSFPGYLVLPLLSLDQVMTYDGKSGYDVVFAAVSPPVYIEVWQTNFFPTASRSELEICTETLASFVKAAAHTIHRMVPADDVDALSDREMKIINDTRNQLNASGQVKIPILRPFQLFQTGLAKSHFSLDLEKGEHAPPDPHLLFTKAASIWSSIQDQKLLPGCKRPHHCDRCWSQEMMECICDIDSDNGKVGISPPANVAVHLNTATSALDSGEELSDDE